MKKILFILLCLLLISSVAYGEEEDFVSGTVELHVIENPSESDFTGIWVPFAVYMRPFSDVTTLPELYAEDYVIIYNQHILIKLTGRKFTDLPYKFEDGAVLSAIKDNTDNPIYVTIQLLTENYALYTIGWGDEGTLEFLSYKEWELPAG